MAQPLAASTSLAENLAMEEASAQRHGYVAGQVLAMTGGTVRHSRLTLNIARLLAERLEGTPRQVFVNDVKLPVRAADSVYYPDVFVRCGTPLPDDARLADDAVLVVEVPSDSTAATDRREKLLAYRRLPGLRAYWLVGQSEQRVEVHTRRDHGAIETVAYAAGEAIPAGWFEGDPIALARLYAGTDLA